MSGFARGTSSTAMWLAAVALLSWACTEAPTTTTDGGRATATLVFATADAQFNRVVVIATDAESGDTLATLTDDVDPAAEELELTLEIELSGESVRVIVTIQLIDATAEGEIVEWSAIVGPFEVTAGTDAVVTDVQLGRGPLSNQTVTSVQVQPQPVVMLAGETLQLGANTTGASAAPTVFWSTLDPAIATVSQSGLLTGVGGGATGVVAAVGTLADTASVFVRAPAFVQVQPPSVTVGLGASLSVSAVVLDQDSLLLAGFPIEWASADSGIADIAGADSTALITGVTVGQTVVTASAGGAVDTVPVQVVLEILQNGGFETGDLSGWTLTNAGSGDFFVMSGDTTPSSFQIVLPAPEGTFAAVTDQGGPGMHIIHQDVTVQTGAAATLTATIYLENRAGVYIVDSTAGLRHDMGPNQHFRIDIMDPAAPVDDVGAGVLLNVFLTLPGDSTSLPYTTVTADLTPFAGQTVRIRFAEVDNQFFFNAGVDAVSVTTTAPPAGGVRSPPPPVVRRLVRSRGERPDRVYRRRN